MSASKHPNITIYQQYHDRLGPSDMSFNRSVNYFLPQYVGNEDDHLNLSIANASLSLQMSHDCDITLDFQGNSGVDQIYGVYVPPERDRSHSFTTSVDEDHNKAVLKSLKPGDMVDIDRGLYNHFGIYVGGSKFVHLSGVNGSMESGLYELFTVSGVEFDKGIVRKDNLWDVVTATDEVTINVKDAHLHPLEPSQTVQRALSKVGETGYNMLFKNCEHLATWCRYDKEESDQADGLIIKLLVLVISIVVAAVSLTLRKLQMRKRKQM